MMYEFRTMKTDEMLTDEEMNALGKEGWFPTVALRGKDNILYIIWARRFEK